jgi:hypothetical protein
MAMSIEQTQSVEIRWNGPGWYGPFQHQDYDGGYVVYYKVNTTAGKDDPFTAGNDAYGHVGTPDWYDSEAEFYA